MVSSDWFDAAVAVNDDPDDGCHPQEAQALREYHEGKTSAREAAYAITRPVATSMSTTLNLERNRLWNLLITALEEWPTSESSAIFSLLKEIEKLPDPIIRDEAKHSVVMSEPFWDELPGFGNMWADSFQWGEWRHQVEDHPDDTDVRRHLREKYTHIASMEAHLADEEVGSINLEWGYECLTDALERKDAVPDIQIPMAAEWLKRLARQIYKDSLDEIEDWPFKRDYLDLRKGGNAMSLERWQAWKDQLEKYVQDGLPGSDSVTMGIRAMDEAEAESEGK